MNKRDDIARISLIKSQVRTSLVKQDKSRLGALVILLFTLVFFNDAVFQGKLLSPIDAACPVDVVWNEACGDIEVAHNGLIASDQAAQFYPWRVLVRNLLKQGTLPLWNPYNYSGYPLLANAQSSVFYPINLLADLLPIRYAFTFRAVILLFVAGFSTFLLARELAISFYGSLLAAFSFAFSSPLIVWLGYAIIEVVVLFPLLLLFTERVFKTDNLLSALPVALTLGIMGLGGHPETLVQAVYVWGFYVIARLLVLSRVDNYALKKVGRIVARLAAASIVGAGLAAVQLLPTWQVLQTSHGYNARPESNISLILGARTDLGSVLSLILLIWPNYFGNPTWQELPNRGNWLSYYNYNGLATYVGFLPIVLVPLAFLRRHQSWVTWVYAGVTFLSLGLLLRLPFFYAITQLPLLHKTSSARFRLTLVLGLAILAGRGLDTLLYDMRGKRWLYGTAISVFTVILSITVGSIGIRLVNSGIRMKPEEFNIDRVIEMINETGGIFPLWKDSYSAPVITFALPLVLSLLVLVVISLTKTRTTELALALVMVTAIDLYIIGSNYNTMLDPELEATELIQKSQTMSYLKQTLKPTDRLAAFGVTFLPNSSSFLGISDVRGYDLMVSDRYYELFAESPGFHAYGPGGFFLTEPNQVLRLLSTNYYLTPIPLPDQEPIFAADSGLLVYYEHNTQPRSYLVHDYQLLPAETIRDKIINSDFDPTTAALIEADPPTWWTTTHSVPSASEYSRITHYEPNMLTVETESQTPAILILTDAYDAGWNAYVDGIRQRIYQTDYILRGVFLQAGHHIVEFRYEPIGFRIGLVLSLLSLIIVLGGGAVLHQKQ